MFMIFPPRENASTANATDEAQGEYTPVRVKRACNRCRIKKSKCNGRIPCARCERDQIACTRGLGPKSDKELSRSYITSLEEQQHTLLSVLKELYRQHPDDPCIQDTMIQLQTGGFDIVTVEHHQKTPQTSAQASENHKLIQNSEPMSWDYNGLSMDNLDAFLLQPATPQVLSDFLEMFSNSSSSQDQQENDQEIFLKDLEKKAPQGAPSAEILSGPPTAINDWIEQDLFLAGSTDFALDPQNMQ